MKSLKLSLAIRAIRRRLDKNQDEFARMVGTQRIAVSRWERGTATPESTKLMRLLNLAKTTAETEPLAAALRRQTGPAFLGAGSAQSLARQVAPILDELEYVDAIIRDIPPERKLVDGVAGLAMIFGALVYRASRVDKSVYSILSLWLDHSSDPAAIQHFEAAAGYLSVQLSASNRPDSKAKRG